MGLDRHYILASCGSLHILSNSICLNYYFWDILGRHPTNSIVVFETTWATMKTVFFEEQEQQLLKYICYAEICFHLFPKELRKLAFSLLLNTISTCYLAWELDAWWGMVSFIRELSDKEIARRDIRQDGALISAAWRTLVTVVFCSKYLGQYDSSFIYICMARYHDHFVKDGQNGSIETASPSYQMQDASVLVFQHFKSFFNASPTIDTCFCWLIIPRRFTLMH